MNDILNKNDIVVFVNAFYTEVKRDEILCRIFATKIKDDEWEVHLERMYSFWNTILFGKTDYRGNPFSKHIDLPIIKSHFNKWLDLLTIAIDDNFSGPKADEVIMRAEKMSAMFQSKLDYLNQKTNYKSIL